jgi:hypothetical protein
MARHAGETGISGDDYARHLSEAEKEYFKSLPPMIKMMTDMTMPHHVRVTKLIWLIK